MTSVVGSSSEASEERGRMAEFMDIHRDMKGITPQQLLDADHADLDFQDEKAPTS
jgi:hypothetical protein